MTDQRQSTRDQWAPPTLEQADPDWTGPASSSQNSAAKDWTDAERPAVDGTVYESAAHESAIDESVVDDISADEPVAEELVAAQPADDGDGLGEVDRSVPAHRSDLDHADLEHADLEHVDLEHVDLEHVDLEHADPEHAVGVASVPDAVAATDTEADTVDRGDLDPPGGVAQDAARIDGPNGAYGIKGNPADVPLVPVPGDDAVASDVTGSGELLPGDVPDEPGLALLDGDTTGRFRDRWQELQLRFVDDPHTAADQAGALVDEVVAALRDAVDGQRSSLEEWQSGDGIDTHFGDTERLRVAVRRYRDFLDRLLVL